MDIARAAYQRRLYLYRRQSVRQRRARDDCGQRLLSRGWGTTYLEFPAGGDDDFVHSYKPVWSDGSEQLYFSDFYNGLTAMSSNVSLAVDKKAGTYGVKIYAVDSWGAVSAEYIEIDNVSIS